MKLTKDIKDIFKDNGSFQQGDSSPRPEAKIYCDGASSGNPGHAGIGVVIQFKKNHRDSATQAGQDSEPDSIDLPGSREDCCISEYIGITTNNVAEYSALVRGLREASSLGLKRIEIFLDSELLVKQIKGIYKIKSAKLSPLWAEAQKILKLFDSYKITHIQRKLNKKADNLAKKAAKGLI